MIKIQNVCHEQNNAAYFNSAFPNRGVPKRTSNLFHHKLTNTMKSILLTCLFLLTSAYSFAQLTVSDVRQSWFTRQGTIEEATLSVRPKGLYMECGLYLTFSARGVTFGTNGDSLEVVLNFTLPEGSILHDSWLWVGNDIVKAHIFDRWTASTIYEGIVNRRQDPSILFKNSATQYQLRVFPMANESTRKVKITWLQPATFLNNRTQLSLPFSLLKTSKNAVLDFNLLVWSDQRFQEPSIATRPELAFEPITDSIGGSFYRASLSPDMFVDDIRLEFASPLKDGYYLSTFSEGGENFYQLAVLPGAFFPVDNNRKIAVLFDYETGANAPTTELLLSSAKSALLNNLGPKDSFNLFFSAFTIKRQADHWIPAHPDTIQQVFAGLDNPLTNYSNLQPLLSSGIQWVQENGPRGEILLVSNSSQYANLSASNALLNDVLEVLDPPVAINTLDYNEKNTPNFFASGVYYYANSYLLSNLATQSGGFYVKTFLTQSLPRAFESSFANMGTHVEAFEMYPSTDNGFCYGRFNVGTGGSLTNLHRPVLQIGKYVGAAPFTVEINGIHLEQPWFSSVDVAAPDILNADTLIREMWYGRLIQALETEAQGNAAIGNVIFNSLAERVLSKYTAFLCLENIHWICPDCEDESQYTSTDDLNSSDSVLTAFPNPFVDRTTVLIKNIGASEARVSFEIYDLKGQLVRLFELGVLNGETRVEWDGTGLSGSEAPAGMYLGMLKRGNQARVMKLVKVKR